MWLTLVGHLPSLRKSGWELDGEPACCSVRSITSDQETHSQPKKSSRNVKECHCDSLADPRLPSPPAQGVLPPMVAWALLKHRPAHRAVCPGGSSVETPDLGDFKLHQVCS